MVWKVNASQQGTASYLQGAELGRCTLSVVCYQVLVRRGELQNQPRPIVTDRLFLLRAIYATTYPECKKILLQLQKTFCLLVQVSAFH